MVLTPTSMKSAIHWILPTSMPTHAQIDQYVDTGFNTIAISEIRYGRQQQDFNDIFAGLNGWTISNNPIVDFINYVHSKGAYAEFVMNVNRYPPRGGWDFFSIPANVSQFKRDVAYLMSIGIDVIQLEEPKFRATTMEVTAFMKYLRSIIPAPKLFGFNMTSNMKSKILTEFHFDVVEFDRVHTFDFVVSQPGKSATAPYAITNEIRQTAYIRWTDPATGIMPGTPCIPCTYVQYSTPAGTAHNVNLIAHVQQAVNNGWGINIWPMDKATVSELTLMKPILTSNTPPTTPTTGSLDLRSIPTGALALVDEVDKGTTNQIIPGLAAGTRAIVLRKEGFVDAADTADIVAGQTTTKEITLTPVKVNSPVTIYLNYTVAEVYGQYTIDVSAIRFSGGKWLTSDNPDAEMRAYSLTKIPAIIGRDMISTDILYINGILQAKNPTREGDVRTVNCPKNGLPIQQIFRDGQWRTFDTDIHICGETETDYVALAIKGGVIVSVLSSLFG